MKLEPNLHEYGILTENSDIRAHVSIVNKAIYVFETVNGIEVVRNKTAAELRNAYQPGVSGVTAKGWPVAIDEIVGLRKVDLSLIRWKEHDKNAMSTSQKGSLAVSVVIYSLKNGLFPMWIESSESDDATIQISGTDVVLAFKKRIQVKCDWACGEKPKGTGNLFLQFSERNPLKAT